MKKCDWKRARSDEQKEQRVKEIIAATERLYNKSKYQNITFAKIAKEAGFTRSNLYKYFRSKEDIFLELLISDFRSWKNDIKQQFNDDDILLIDDFAKKWINALNNNQRLIELISILYLHLEKEATYDSLLKLKSEFNKEFFETVQLISNKLPGLNEDKAIKFFNMQNALVVGLIQTCDLSENQVKILERKEFSHYKIDFDQTLKESIIFILNGIVNS